MREVLCLTRLLVPSLRKNVRPYSENSPMKAAIRILVAHALATFYYLLRNVEVAPEPYCMCIRQPHESAGSSPDNSYSKKLLCCSYTYTAKPTETSHIYRPLRPSTKYAAPGLVRLIF